MREIEIMMRVQVESNNINAAQIKDFPEKRTT